MKSKAAQTNLVVPETLRLEVHQVISANAPPQVLQLPPGNIAIELHQPADSKPKWQRVFIRITTGLWLFIKDVVPPLASVIIAFFVFYYGREFNNRQATTQEEQAATSRSELQLKILLDFTNSLADLTDESDKKEKKQTLAAIKFVQYGEKALPIIKIALGVEETTVRKGATVVVVHMFQARGIDRTKLLSELKEYFKAQGPFQRRGVLECFVKLQDHLSSEEADDVVDLLKNTVDPGADCSKQEEDDVLVSAAVFLGARPSLDSERMLLKIAENHSCIRPRIQAVDNLPAVAEKLRPEEREAIIARLRHLIPDPSKSLTNSIAVAIEKLTAMQ